MGYRSQAAMSGVMMQLLLPLLILLLLLTALNVAAQTPSASDCTTQYGADLSSCGSYLTNAATVPGTECCSGIATVEKDSLFCLCEIVSQLGTAAGVNLTRAYAIPKDCNLTFSNSSCSAAGISPTASTPTTTGASPSPTGGVAAAPSKNGGAKSIIVPSLYTVFGAMVLGCVGMVLSVVADSGVITAV
ncbi:unnamed protein product [Sphagnum compactum]